IEMNDEWLDEIKSNLCELPIQKQNRFVSDYKLSDYDAGVLAADRATAEFFDGAVKLGADAKRVCNILTQTGLKMANEKGCSAAELGVSVENLATLAKMVDAGDINANAATKIFEEMTASDKGPAVLAGKLNLVQKSDAGEIEGFVDEVLGANAEAVAEAKSGSKKSKKAMGFLMGQVMQKSKGQANPQVVSQLLNKKLGESE
ncbi:MAG: GatB/YqeY domain-containing protein, partial [Anaerohalosphaera sp.]|nr:GatB/YqeY domain-containing protein [Anaerohalosphaera sp.]